MTQSVNSNSGASLPFGDDYINEVSTLVGAGQSRGIGGVDTEALLNQLCMLTSSTGENPGVGGLSGAPELALPALNFTTDDMAILLTALRSKTFEGQIRVGKEGLEISGKKTQDINDRAMKKIQEWVDKSKEALEKSKAGGIAGWIASIFTFIAAAICTALAAVAAVLTGGAAIPLLAVSVVLLAGATMSLASNISQQCGGPALEPSAWLSDLMTNMLVSFGMDKEQAKSAGKAIAGAAAIMLTGGAALAIDPQLLGNLVGGIAELSGVDKDTAMWLNVAFTIAATLAVMVVMVVVTGGAAAPQAVAKIAKIADVAAKSTEKAAKIGQTLAKNAAAIQKGGQIMVGTAGLTSGAGQISSGVFTIQSGEAQRLADNALADKKELEAFLMKLQKLMEEGREDLKKIMQGVEEMMSVCIRMLTSNSEQHSQLIGNIGSSNTRA